MTTERRSSSLALRALLAVALFVGFYALGAAIVLGLFWVPWAQAQYEGHVGVSGLACAAFALWIGFALLPRFGPSRPTAEPPLPHDAHVRLRALVDETARAVGEAPPDDVYLLASVNAFAARTGSFMGFGGRRLIGIGLPLLSAMEEDEVRSVIAHELGHHHAGDVVLGPWVHRTRMAVARALARLEGAAFVLHLPFALYARAFLRVTRQASRDQELAADAVAARVAGADATARALIGAERLAARWSAYYHGEVVPLIASGFRPPLLDGFQRFLAQPDKRADVEELMARVESAEHRDSDTHPALAERLAALASSRVTRPPATSSALHLLDSVERAEHDVLDLVLAPGHAPLKEVAWDDVPKAWLGLWRARMRAEPKLAALPRALDAWESYEPPSHGISLLSPAAKRKRFAERAGVRLAVGLADLGFVIETPPGGETRATKDGHTLEPEALARRLASGELDAAGYRRALRGAGALDEP
jgi:Zn-dependent protease with chaperone function